MGTEYFLYFYIILLKLKNLKELSIPLGPRKKLLQFIKAEAQSEPVPVVSADVPDLGIIEEGMDVNVQYRQYDTGVGAPKIRYFSHFHILVHKSNPRLK